MSLSKKALLYTDGACTGNPGPGGYGTILRHDGQEKILQAGFRLTTNNRMELLAVIVGLEALPTLGYHVIIYADSRYVVDAVEKKWLNKWLVTHFKGKKNPDLWKRFWHLSQQHQVKLRWVRGHAGHPENERCDQLATEVAQKGPWLVDQVYEQKS